jgi:hypothetical protein
MTNWNSPLSQQEKKTTTLAYVSQAAMDDMTGQRDSAIRERDELKLQRDIWHKAAQRHLRRERDMIAELRTCRSVASVRTVLNRFDTAAIRNVNNDEDEADE